MSNHSAPGRRHLTLGGLAGLLAGTAAVAVSEGVAAVLSGVTSPLLAVGNRAVDAAPRPVKEWAIETFGTADKPVLIGGVITAVALLAVVAGALGARRPRFAVGLFLLLVAVATLAALTDRAATAGTALRLLPALALVVVGLPSLLALLRALREPAEPAEPGEPGEPGTAGVPRRSFLRAAAGVAGVAVVGGVLAKAYGGLAATASRAGLRLPRPASPAPAVPPGVEVGVDGVTPYLTDNADFYRVDTALRVPDVPLEGWTLRIHGMVDTELEPQLRRPGRPRRPGRAADHPDLRLQPGRGRTTLGNATWLGVPLHDAAGRGRRAGRAPTWSSPPASTTAPPATPLAALTDTGRGALLAVGMNGEPLPLEHGFPVRMVVPGPLRLRVGHQVAGRPRGDPVRRLRGVLDHARLRRRGADQDLQSRIDVPALLRPGRRRAVRRSPGWPGRRTGASRGSRSGWTAAPGRRPTSAPSTTSTPGVSGSGTGTPPPATTPCEVRATDATGATQTSRRAPIAPDGSTGWDSVTVTVS